MQKLSIQSFADIKENTVSKHNIPIIGYGIDVQKLGRDLDIDMSECVSETFEEYMKKKANTIPEIYKHIVIVHGSNIDSTFFYIPAALPIDFDGNPKPQKQFMFSEVIDGIVDAVTICMHNTSPQIIEYIYEHIGLIATTDYL